MQVQIPHYLIDVVKRALDTPEFRNDYQKLIETYQSKITHSQRGAILSEDIPELNLNKGFVDIDTLYTKTGTYIRRLLKKHGIAQKRKRRDRVRRKFIEYYGDSI